jgi:hypothetical protein
MTAAGPARRQAETLRHRFMNEQQWLSATDPQQMLEWLRNSGKASERKLRLFAVACCRRIWHLLTDGRSRRAVEVAECLVNGQAVSDERLAEARLAPYYEGHLQPGPVNIFACDAAALLNLPDAEGAAYLVAQNAISALLQAPWMENRSDPEEHIEAAAAANDERCCQAALIRDLFGNPFRPLPPLDPSSLDCKGGAVVHLARAVYEERLLPEGRLDPARLAALADALEEGGYDTEEILAHLRSPGPHVRGCYVVDAILGWD